MSDALIKLASSIATASASKQFTFILRIMVFIMAVITATTIAKYYFGPLSMNLGHGTIIQTVFSPPTVVWLLFFLLIYFGIYPLFAKILVVIYRFIYPPRGRIKRQLLKGVNEGISWTGVDIKMRQLTAEQLPIFHSEMSVWILEEEVSTVERYGSLLAILIQSSIWYTSFLNESPGLLRLSLGLSAAIILYIFTIHPWIYKSMRTWLVAEYKKIHKDRNTSNNQAKTTS